MLETFNNQTNHPPVFPKPPLAFPPVTKLDVDASRLTNNYPAAYKDFYGLPSNPACVYKSGPAWRENTGPNSYRITREARPVYDHPIADQWHAIGTKIYQFLDTQSIKWTSIDPVAFAEEGGGNPVLPTPYVDRGLSRVSTSATMR